MPLFCLRLLICFIIPAPAQSKAVSTDAFFHRAKALGGWAGFTVLNRGIAHFLEDFNVMSTHGTTVLVDRHKQLASVS